MEARERLLTDLPSGQVTIGDLYRELVGMRGDLTRSLTKLEVIESRNTDADRLHADHETRIRQLEKFKWQIIGALILASALGAYIGYLVGRK